MGADIPLKMQKRFSLLLKSYLRLPAWLSLGILLCAGSRPAMAETIRKVICQYALTSANDFPQRDPRDWRLLGSNDGGRTWVVLDEETNQIFATRQERRVYKVRDHTAFESFRLEIDRVRNPEAASSVQLAELELLGPKGGDDDPTPALADTVSAQGDNPPGETTENLFDGRVETKWLDWASDENTRASWIQWQYAPAAEMVATNIRQLLTLRSRAADGIRVGIQAVVDGWEGKETCLVDDTGCVLLGGINRAETLHAGQKILLTGTSTWANNRVGVKSSHVQLVGPAVAAPPERISLDEPLSPGENLKWVEIEGDIQYPHLTEGEVAFDVQGGTSTMRVHAPFEGKPLSLPPPGTQVMVRGVCLGAFDVSGRWVAAGLWAAGRQSLAIADAGETNQTPTGVVPPAPPKPDGATILTKIEDVRRLTPEELNAHPRVKIRGTITDELQGFVQDGTAGIEVAFSPGAKRKIPGFGAYIDITGWAELDDVGSPEIWADDIASLGAGKLPQPEKLTPGEFANGRIDAQWVEADGVVQSTDGSHLLLASYGQDLTATITEAPVDLVNELVDAEVRVRGVAVTARDEDGRVQGIHLLIPSLDYVDIVTPPANPETLPVRKVGGLLGLSGPGEPVHRVKIEGVVTLEQGQRIFFHDDTGNAMAILKENVVLDARFGHSHWLYWQSAPSGMSSSAEAVLNPGDRVQVVGFPEAHRYSPMLTEAVVSPLGGRDALVPVGLTPEGLAEGGLDSSLVTFEGVLRGQTAIGSNTVLDMEWRDRILQVLVPRKPDESVKIETGSRLRVTGVCQIDPPSYPELGLIAGPVHILTRSPEDLTILARPPWWTVGRALTLIGGMTFVMLAGLVWIRVLRRQVNERTAELANEIRLREQAESRHALEEERARIAKDLHDDLGANLTQIVFLSERVEVARHDGQEVIGWFDKIPATAQRTIQSLDEIVWAVNPRHDSLESLANYLSQFAQQHLTLGGVRCVLDVPTVLPSVPLSAEVRHNLLLATREALQNAVAHAGALEVRLALRLDNDGLTITVSDNGKGFETASASPFGNGLQNMRQRLQGIGGRLDIRSKPGEGTTVSFFVPRHLLHGRVIGGDRNFGEDV